MKAGGGGEPGTKLADAIKASFGSFEEFSKQFKAAGATQFGSGWAWLVTDKGGMLTGALMFGCDICKVVLVLLLCTGLVWRVCGAGGQAWTLGLCTARKAH